MNKITWYNAKNKKPRNGLTLLAICGGSVKEILFKNDSWGEYHPSAITHWAYLNKPRVKKNKHVEVKPANAPMIMNGNFQAFKSPLDGSVITCPSKLRDHNKKHGVTNIADYNPSHFEKRGKEMQLEARGQTAQAKLERQQLIDKTLTEYGV